MSSHLKAILEAGAAFRLGDWLVEPSLNRVSRGEVVTQLELKAMDVLVYLAERAGEVVDKRELQDAVWQTEFVSENTLTRRIAELREALGDDAKHSRSIETIPKRGYRLIATVGPAQELDETVAPFPQRATSESDRAPYPGLAPFTEADADDFFGREAEVVALWRKIADRRLLAVIGPSGAGKSSLLRAGVVARAPDGWRAVVCHPGEDPVVELARALAPDLSSDVEEVRELPRFHDPDVALAVVSRWRARSDDALIVVDQFEELFTLNASAVQDRFVALLRRLVDAAGVHAVLVLRDDFLFECHRFPVLEPILKDLTLVGPPVGSALRRALTEPAARRLHRFEGELLVDEMVAEVERERGALPLLAFAASRLWELRDRDRRLLTREAYERIGGVGGALAQHAEATLETIGPERLPIVRELFRNLVTAQGTRAVREWDELLSVFADSQRESAREVLGALVDARLLTSFELGADGEGPTRRVEIIHESLLSNWPRLVRWQAQDAEGAVLRDQLRQAAKLWAEKGRPDDLLWTGTSYREYGLWRERYRGGLTELEEAFGRAMTELADRRRRRRRVVVTAAMVVLLAVAAALSVLWRRSVQQTRRAEAHKLIALGQVELERSPATALAFARASLEVADSAEARRLAVDALWAGPPTMFFAGFERNRPVFSPDGGRLAASGFSGDVTIMADHGGEPLRISGLPVMPELRGVAFTPAGDRLLSWLSGDPSIRIFSADGEQLDTLPSEATDLLVLDEDTVATYGAFATGAAERAVRLWSLREHSSRLVARWQPPPLFMPLLPGLRPLALDPSLRYLAHGEGAAVHLLGLRGAGAGREIELGSHEAKIRELAFAPDGSRLLSVDEGGGFQVWSVAGGKALRTLDASAPHRYCVPTFDASGSKVGWTSTADATVWNLADPPDAAPRLLRARIQAENGGIAFDSEGRWAAAAPGNELTLWSLASPYPRVLRGHSQDVLSLTFTADSNYLASCARDGARLWPLSPEGGRQRLVDLGEEAYCYGIAADAATPTVLLAVPNVGAFLMQPDGAPPRRLEGIPPTVLDGCVLDTRAGIAAVGVNYAPDARDMLIHVADLRTGATRAFPTRDPASRDAFAGSVASLGFASDGSLVSGGEEGVFRWNLATGERTRIFGEAHEDHRVMLNASGTTMVALVSQPWPSEVLVIDLLTGAQRRITSHGDTVVAAAMDATGDRIATGDANGAVRVGRATGKEPHLLLGHRGRVVAVAFSPDGKWLASASGTEIILWPVPDLSKPPLHTLPHAELLAKLGSLTNLRAVRDPASSTGWSLGLGPFPGWDQLPDW